MRFNVVWLGLLGQLALKAYLKFCLNAKAYWCVSLCYMIWFIIAYNLYMISEWHSDHENLFLTTYVLTFSLTVWELLENQWSFDDVQYCTCWPTLQKYVLQLSLGKSRFGNCSYQIFQHGGTRKCQTDHHEFWLFYCAIYTENNLELSILHIRSILS